MDDLKTLFDNVVLSEETKEQVTSALNEKLNTEKELIAEELRKEFAARYEHDKNILVESIELFLKDSIKDHVLELAEQKKEYKKSKEKLEKEMKSQSDLIEKFILEALKREIHEFREDRKTVQENISKLQTFVIEATKNEILEFAQDKKELAEERVRFERDKAAAIVEAKKELVKRSVPILESFVKESLKAEILPLRKDIMEAKNNMFGRKLFEAFAAEFMSSQYSDSTESKQLLKVLTQTNSQLKEANEKLAKQEKAIMEAKKEAQMIKSLSERKIKLAELTSSLGGSEKEIMCNLLESVETSKLAESFNRYLPAVLKKEVSSNSRTVLSEKSREITGDKQHLTEDKSEIFESYFSKVFPKKQI